MKEQVKLFSKSLAKQAFDLLTKREKSKIIKILFFQINMSLLDLLGIIFISALGSLSVRGLQSQEAGNKVSILLRYLGISNYDFKTQALILGFASALLLVTKTLLSVFFTRKIFFFLSHVGARISTELASRLFAQDLLKLQQRSSQETLFLLTSGVQNLMIGVLATTVQILVDFSLLLIIVISLFFVDPILAIGTVAFFASILGLLNYLLQVRARRIGMESFEQTISINEKILEAINIFRELKVKNRLEFYVKEINNINLSKADNIAESSFMPFISKYVLDSVIVIGALILGAYEFSVNQSSHALAVISLFVAAASRVTPAALRLQQGLLSLKNSEEVATETISLHEELKNSFLIDSHAGTDYAFSYPDFIPNVEITNLNFKYPNSHEFTLNDLNLTIPKGSFTAIVGPSGGGKTTLIDLILGVISSSDGNILVSGKTPKEATNTWPGAIAYVPQESFIANGTISENISLGYADDHTIIERVKSAISMAQLDNFVRQLPNGIDTKIGENGMKLSGGQKQRLGIARALFTNPKLLVLDEATSSLDGKTEFDLSEEIQKLKGDVTILIVAHRLSTVRDSDQVIYIDKGKLSQLENSKKLELKFLILINKHL